MKSKLLIVLFLAVVLWNFFHPPQAHWQGQLAPADPEQSIDGLPLPWIYKDFTVIPRAKYRIKAIILSKHHYWIPWMGGELSPYDLALGWGPLSDAQNINEFITFQLDRWYFMLPCKNPHLDPYVVEYHSANHHIIPGNQNVRDMLPYFKTHDVVEMEGYLVDVQSNKGDWVWHTSVSRSGAGAGGCKLFWVTNAFSPV